MCIRQPGLGFKRKSKDRRRSAVLLAFLTINICSFGQTQEDRAQISNLVDKLSSHPAKVGALLDPALKPTEHDNNLKYFRDSSYQLTLVPSGDIEFGQPGHASMPVRIRFKSATRELDAGNKAEFVKRGEKWYFATFAFVGTSATLISVAVIGVLVGICYAAVVLTLRKKLVRQGRLTVANTLQLFIPVFWPVLYRSKDV
jgi:hypothetical protein